MSILFDLDGTLLDTAPDFLFAINQIRAEENLTPLSMDTIRPLISHGAREVTKAGFNTIQNELQIDLLSARFLKTYAHCSGAQTKLFPGMAELLDYLEKNQIPWGIVTNKKMAFTDPLLEKLNLAKRAACIVSGDTTPYQKPHPAPLLHACRTIQVAPQQCLYIGDAKSDIDAGKAAGMTTLGALFGYIESVATAKTWGADHYIEHAYQILPWYQAWQLNR